MKCIKESRFFCLAPIMPLGFDPGPLPQRFVLFLCSGVMKLARMSRPPLLNLVAPWIAAAALWLWLFVHLHVEWSLNAQYNYGWAVPFLALLLFYFRWQRRPAPDIGARNNMMIKLGVALDLALLFPIRVIEEANPDWRLL